MTSPQQFRKFLTFDCSSRIHRRNSREKFLSLALKKKVLKVQIKWSDEYVSIAKNTRYVNEATCWKQKIWVNEIPARHIYEVFGATPSRKNISPSEQLI
jgi:hypothetical protein